MKFLHSFSIFIVLWIPHQAVARGRGGGGIGGGFRGGGTHFAPPALGLASANRKPDCHPYKRIEVVTGVDGEECKRIPGGSRRAEGIGHCQPKPTSSRALPQQITVSDVTSIPQVTENSISNSELESQVESRVNASLEINSTSSAYQNDNENNMDNNNEIVIDEPNGPAQFNITEVVIECVCEWVIECMENGGVKTSSKIPSLFAISPIFLSTFNFYL